MADSNMAHDVPEHVLSLERQTEEVERAKRRLTQAEGALRSMTTALASVTVDPARMVYVPTPDVVHTLRYMARIKARLASHLQHRLHAVNVGIVDDGYTAYCCGFEVADGDDVEIPVATVLWMADIMDYASAGWDNDRAKLAARLMALLEG